MQHTENCHGQHRSVISSCRNRGQEGPAPAWFAAAGLHAAEPADLIVHNAKVTMNVPGQAEAAALAVRGDRIVAVGTNEAVLALRGEGTRVIDGGGRWLRRDIGGLSADDAFVQSFRDDIGLLPSPSASPPRRWRPKRRSSGNNSHPPERPGGNAGVSRARVDLR